MCKFILLNSASRILAALSVFPSSVKRLIMSYFSNAMAPSEGGRRLILLSSRSLSRFRDTINFTVSLYFNMLVLIIYCLMPVLFMFMSKFKLIEIHVSYLSYKYLTIACIFYLLRLVFVVFSYFETESDNWESTLLIYASIFLYYYGYKIKSRHMLILSSVFGMIGSFLYMLMTKSQGLFIYYEFVYNLVFFSVILCKDAWLGFRYKMEI